MRILRLAVIFGLLVMPASAVAQDRKATREKIMREAQAAQANAPKVGETAPDFKLKVLDGSVEESLSDLHAKKPLVLLFGSYT